MLAGQRLIVHFITEQGLRVQGRRHIQRFVVIIRALDVDKTRRGIGPNHLQEIRKPRSAEAADDIPAFHANVPGVLTHFGRDWNCASLYSPGFCTAPVRSASIVEVNARIFDVVTVDGEFLERGDFGVREGGRQMPGAKQLGGYPIAESQSGFKQRFLKFGDGESSDRKHRSQFQQFAAGDTLELATVDS